MLCQEGSDSGQESNDGTGTSRKPPKRGRGKIRPNSSKELDGHFPDLSQSPLAASSYGCLSLLKKKRSGGKHSLSLFTHMCARECTRARAHTHTHTHIYIYIYNFVNS